MANRRKAPLSCNGLITDDIEKLTYDNSTLNSKLISQMGDVGSCNADKNLVSHERMKDDAGLSRHDKSAIVLLMFLYILQGIPLGLAGCLPYLIQDKKVSYTDQAKLSLVFWPFSVKLLWAPLVDSIFIARFGRRKSWLVPTQFLIGSFMIFLSSHVNSLMGEDESSKGIVNVTVLSIAFFILDFLAATQDIAVDGWALTMLSRANVGWASTCNAVGQTAGYFLGNVVFLTLQSAEFCNTYIRYTPASEGLVTFPGYLFFWGVIFISLTTLVMLFKKEESHSFLANNDDGDGDDDIDHSSIIGAYQLLWRIIKLPSVLSLIVVLLTAKVGFSAADAVTGLKLIEEGMSKETLTLLGVFMVPLETAMPLFISRYTVGTLPMNLYLKAVPFRLLLGLAFTLVVYWAPYAKTPAGGYPVTFYLALIVGLVFHQIAMTCMYVSTMSFFARISDPAVGGTYMTLLNTVTNFAGSWPNTLVLYCMDSITWQTCHLPTGDQTDCSSKQGARDCKEAGGTCETHIDGYYIASVVCCIIGFVWLTIMSTRLKRLQSLPANAWSVIRR